MVIKDAAPLKRMSRTLFLTEAVFHLLFLCLSCSWMIIKDATPVTPTSQWAELYFQMKQFFTCRGDTKAWWTDRQKEGRMDRQTDLLTDRQTDRQCSFKKKVSPFDQGRHNEAIVHLLFWCLPLVALGRLLLLVFPARLGQLGGAGVVPYLGTPVRRQTCRHITAPL